MQQHLVIGKEAWIWQKSFKILSKRKKTWYLCI